MAALPNTPEVCGAYTADDAHIKSVDAESEVSFHARVNVVTLVVDKHVISRRYALREYERELSASIVRLGE